MVDLTREGRALVAAILGGTRAWRSPAELAGATGLGAEETTDLLAVLDAQGWIAAWERPDDVVVTLSVAGASWLDVRLVESGPEQEPRWAWRTDPEPPPPRASGVFRADAAARLELVVDARPGPDLIAERSEEVALALALASTDPSNPISNRVLPRPTILVGSGLSPWPGPSAGPARMCPACGSRRLGPTSYCLCCDRWGLDHLIRVGPPSRPALDRDPDEEARARKLGRLARKEKRRARRSAQGQPARRKPPGGRPAGPS